LFNLIWTVKNKYDRSSIRSISINSISHFHRLRPNDVISAPILRKYFHLGAHTPVFSIVIQSLGGLSQQKLDVFMSNICLATNCRDKVATCPQMIQLGNSCNSNYMAENCRNSCGCVTQECPPIITDDVVMEVMVEHDAEHSDEIIDLR